MKNILAYGLTSARITDYGIEGKTSLFHIRISVFGPHTVRVRLSPDGSFDENPYSVIIGPVAEFKVEETKEDFQLTTSALKLGIQKNPFRLRLWDAEGNLLNEDDPGLGTSVMGTEISCYKTLQPGERFIGLGEKTGRLDRRGQAFTHWNTDAFGYREEADPLYLSTPFWLGLHHQHCYGIYLNNTWRSHMNLGASTHRFQSFAVEGGTMDYFLFTGRSPIEIVDAYTQLTGRPQLPPRWSLGLQQCRYSYYPDFEVTTVAETFRKKKIPADVIYLDIHYMEKYKVFTWSGEHFANARAMLKELRELGFRVVVIIDPGIKVEKGYGAYDRGIEGGHFVQYPDGTPYQGHVWPGWCHFPDFTNPQTRKWWGNEMETIIDEGIAGFWTDMNEPATWGQRIPELLEHSLEGRGGHHKEAHNIYGMQMARATYEGVHLHRPETRPFVLTRAGFSGIQRHAAVWTGDNRAEDGHMLLGVRLLNAMGLSGISFAGMDIGGFVGDCPRDLFARWITIGCFSPMARIHTMIDSMDSEPWSYGEKIEAISRNFINLRYRLLPYIYSLFARSHQSGLPVQRSMAFTHPHHHQTYSYDNQFWVGDYLLVCACSAYQHFTKVFLPEAGAKWYDLYEDTRWEPGEPVAEAPLDRLPVFVKPGAIIPMQSLVQHTGEAGDGILSIHLYCGPEVSHFELYWDEGDGYGYQRGEYLKHTLTQDPERQSFFITPAEGTYPSPWHTVRLIYHGYDQYKKVASLPPSPVALEGEPEAVEIKDLISANYRFIDPLPAFDPFGNDQSVHDASVMLVDFAYSATGMWFKVM